MILYDLLIKYKIIISLYKYTIKIKENKEESRKQSRIKSHNFQCICHALYILYREIQFTNNSNDFYIVENFMISYRYMHKEIFQKSR